MVLFIRKLSLFIGNMALFIRKEKPQQKRKEKLFDARTLQDSIMVAVQTVPLMLKNGVQMELPGVERRGHWVRDGSTRNTIAVSVERELPQQDQVHSQKDTALPRAHTGLIKLFLLHS